MSYSEFFIYLKYINLLIELPWFIPLPIHFQGHRFPVPNRGCRLYPHRHQYRAPFPNSFQGWYRSLYLRQFRSQFLNRCRKQYHRRFPKQCRAQFLRQSPNLFKLCFNGKGNLRLSVRSIAKTEFSQSPTSVCWIWNLKKSGFCLNHRLIEVECSLFTKVNRRQISGFAIRVFGPDIKNTARIRAAVVCLIPLKICFFPIGNRVA